jgi:hypothetical protein
MNILNHQRKVVRFIECDGFPIFGEERKKVSEAEDSQLRIIKLLGINEATFLKYFKDEPGASNIDTAQARINKALGISPELFKKWNN